MHVHKCVMNTREKSSYSKDQTQYSTVNLVRIWIEPFGYISMHMYRFDNEGKKKKNKMNLYDVNEESKSHQS